MRLRSGLVILLVLSYPVSSSSAYAIEGTFYLLDGQNIPLSNYEGQFILIDGFATWCDPCKLQMGYLHDVHDVAKDKVEILSISFDQTDTFQKVEHFKETYSGNWTFGLDQDHSLNQYLKVEGYPTTYLIDDTGQILKKWLGLTDSQEILLEMDKYMDLPGSLGRRIASNELIGFLLSSPFFLFFLIVIWMVIIIFSVKSIRILRENRS